MTRKRLLFGSPVMFIVIAAMLFLPLHMASAANLHHAPSHSPKHHIPHYMAKHRVTTRAIPADSSGNMVYGGGQVMTGNVQVFLIFWLPNGESFSNGYQDLQAQFYNDFSQTSVFGIIGQYTDSNGNAAQSVSLGGTWTDTSPFPGSTVLDSDIQNEVQNAVQQNNWPTGYSSIFFVYTPADEPVCFDSGGSQCSTNTFCAYHDGFDANGQTYLYGSIPDEGGCGIPNSPNNNTSADGSVDSGSHELMEAMSDARPNSGWSNPSTGEIGDPCAHQYGPQDSNGGDVTANGHEYLIQPEWSNAVGGCSMS